MCGTHERPGHVQPSMKTFLVLLIATVALGACGSDDGATALWDIDTRDPPTSQSTSFVAFVTRLGCASGKTGEVHDPVVFTDRDRVVVTFSVAPLSGNHQCQGNDEVRHVVDLDEPIGGRELVDGACLSGEAVSTSLCSEGAVRWSP